MREPGDKTGRIKVTYFDGVNPAVQRMLAKRTELYHAENARAPIIGILEKREGQAKKGTAANGAPFYATENYALIKYPNPINRGLFRISTAPSDQSPATVTFSVYDHVFLNDVYGNVSNPTLRIFAIDYVAVSEPTFFTLTDSNTIILDGTAEAASIYGLSSDNVWTVLSDADAQNLIGGQFDYVATPVGLLMVNGKSYNRLLQPNGTSVLKSTDAGSLYNSPRARRCAFYKSRMYLGDYYYNGIRYNTSVIRSSYSLGIVSLVNGDHTALASGSTLALLDTKYIYADTGMNQYDIYRGSTKIVTVTVTNVAETEVTVTFSGPVDIQSSDEVWAAGTYTGEKQFRWVNNATSFGRDVKQYDTFQLAGGDEDELTMLEPVGNILMIASKNAMMTWNDYTLENFDLGIGCVSSNGYAKLLGKIYFVHYSGFYYTGGSTPVLISRKVSRYFSGATKYGLEHAAVGAKGLSIFCTIGDVTLYNDDGSLWKTLSDVCLEYATGDQNWYIHTNVPAAMLRNFIDSNGTEQLVMAHSGGGRYVKEFLSGNTDDGENIFFRADLQTLQFLDEFEIHITPNSVVTESQRGSSTKCFVAMDDGPYFELKGTVTKGQSILKVSETTAGNPNPTTCKLLHVSYRDSSQQRCRIIQSAIIYTVTTMDRAE